MTKTKIAIASLLTIGFASSAFASDSFLAPNNAQANQAAVQQRVVTGTQAYAYAPADRYTATASTAEQREFNRVDVDTVSSR